MKAKQLTDVQVTEIARTAAQNVTAPGAVAAEQHNTRTIAVAIQAALEKAGVKITVKKP